MKSEDISYYHQIMDTHPTTKNLHGEEPTPLQSNIDIGDDDKLDLDTSSKKEEEALTFWIKPGGVSIEQQFSETESEGTHFSLEKNNPNKIPIELSFQQSNEDIEYYEEDPEAGSSTVFSSEQQRFSSTYDGDTSESGSTTYNSKKYEDKDKVERGGGAGEVVSSLQEYSQSTPEHLVQSLSRFFTRDEKE